MLETVFLNHILSWIVFTPVIGIIVLFFIPKEKTRALQWVSVVATFSAFVLSAILWCRFQPSSAEMQAVEYATWIPQFGIGYSMGVDGISMPLVMLTTLLSFLAAVASFSIKERIKEYYILYLLLVTGMLGVFVSLDLVLFYVFWEVVLVPMYFLIGIWGGAKREYAAIKFFLYTLLGSVVMLLGILALFFKGGAETFNMLELGAKNFGLQFQIIVYLALFLGFAIKVPVFPFHTWLPDAHVEAPTAISVLLAGVLLKMGGYGILRVSYSIVPNGALWFTLPLAILGLINIIYGALVAMAQKDMKKLVAYSSVSHMGYVLLGIAALTYMGFNGAVLQMFNHGIITGALFLLVGVIYDRAHVRQIDGFGGLARTMPIFAGVMSFSCFASLGLPGLSGFVGEFFSLVGAFKPNAVLSMDFAFKAIVIASASGIVITAGYFLWMLQRIFMGKENEKWKKLPDISGRELFTIIPLMILMLLIGIWPRLLVDVMNPTIIRMVDFVASLAGGK